MKAEELKKLTEQKIVRIKLKPNKNMPVNLEFEELKFRNAEDIGKRIMVLVILIGILYKQKRRKLKKLIEQHELKESLSKNEEKILNKWILTKQDKINVGWFSENIEVLGWSVGLWDKIEYFEVCDEYKQSDMIPTLKKPFKDFLVNLKLVDKNKIYEEFDFIYRMHGIAKNRKIGKLENYTESAFREKHKAINWIVGIENDWDEIPTDT